MVDPSDPSMKNGASRPRRTPSALQAGLTAVQKKQYREAIALLQGIAQGSWDVETLAKARIGLVKAYAGLGQMQEAIALCEELTAVPIPSVYQWANDMLRQLKKSARPVEPQSGKATAFPEADLATGLTKRPPTNPPSEPPIPSKLPTTPASKKTVGSPSVSRVSSRVSLGQIDVARLWLLEAVTVAGLITLLVGLFYSCRAVFNYIVIRITVGNFTLRHLANYGDLRWVAVPLVAIALLSSFWILRLQLKYTKGLKPLTFDELKQYSPEAGRVLQTFARQKRSLSPKLACLPDALPMALSYGGVLPRQSHLVLSRGLLEQLSDDEIAAVVAAELAHLQFRDAAVLSGLLTLAQIPFVIYELAAQWGDRRRHIALKAPAILLSVIAYGVFWSIRLMGLWLSRMRLFYSDRIATELTGAPNSLSRALLKMTVATAQEIERQGETPPFLEQFDLLSPVGGRSVLPIGSLYTPSSPPALWEWDYTNPFRRWLSIRDSHPPLGDRLYTLSRYAQRWRIPSDLEWTTPPPPRPTRAQGWRMAIQSLPMLGAVIGLTVGQGLWLFGLLADKVGWLSLDWFQSGFIHLVSIFIGFSVGTFLRINLFFPEIKRPNDVRLTQLPDLLTRSADALPVDAPAVKFQGVLLGRRGIANAIGQDLLLKTDAGLVRLHFLPTFPFQQNPIASWAQLQTFLHRPVMATGWFRRGVTPWLDLDVLQSQSGKPLRGGHPLWSTVLALILVLWSCYTIINGDL